MTKPNIKFTQIQTGPVQTTNGLQHSLYGLGDDGKVYLWKMDSGWIEMNEFKKSVDREQKAQ